MHCGSTACIIVGWCVGGAVRCGADWCRLHHPSQLPGSFCPTAHMKPFYSDRAARPRLRRRGCDEDFSFVYISLIQIACCANCVCATGIQWRGVGEGQYEGCIVVVHEGVDVMSARWRGPSVELSVELELVVTAFSVSVCMICSVALILLITSWRDIV